MKRNPLDDDLHQAAISFSQGIIDLKTKLAEAEASNRVLSDKLIRAEARADEQSRQIIDITAKYESYMRWNAELVTQINVIGTTVADCMTKARREAYSPNGGALPKLSAEDIGIKDDRVPLKFLRDRNGEKDS